MPQPRLLQNLLVACALGAAALPARAGGIYAQIVVPFPDVRAYTQAYNAGEHALVLAFKKTSPSELAPLDDYDERLIKRVVVKDLGPAGTEVKLILRNRDVRAVVSQFTEPFRVAIDLFDADYAEEHDPETGMPLVGGRPAADPGARAGGGLRLLDGEDGATGRPAPAPAGGDAAEGTRRHLLQATPELFTNPAELAGAMRDTAGGLGKSWKDFPPYIYRLQTAAYEAGLATDRRPGPSGAKALTSAQAMADYAGKLYDFGQETKALVAYQQVLRKEPALFDRDALHLWKFAETHLGQGNLTLARGYFEALTQKHPESPLANFARLRVLDIQSLQLAALGRTADWPGLAPGLAQIKLRHNGELAAQVALRQAWWAKDIEAGALPRLAPPVRDALSAAYPAVESSHTAYLAASLLLHDMLAADTPWQRSTGAFAEAYFKRFSGASTEPYRALLRAELDAKLNSRLPALIDTGKLLEAVGDYEALPASLRQVKQTPKTAWALAEAYRKLAQGDKALPLYALAAKGEAEGPGRFKAEFWLSVTAGELAEALRLAGGDAERAARLTVESRAADRAADAAWAHLKDDERQQLSVAYKADFERTVISPAKLRTGPKIVLASWTKALTTKAAAQNGGDQADWSRNFSPSGSAVLLLTDLGKRFGELGDAAARRQAIGLLKTMKPAEFEGDQAAKATWARQLVALAEDYRKASQYLDAGRLFSLVGDGSENWEGRAESLYKGGLLLYRAGQRAEATAAFKKASEDGNNLFYANLAKERLSQLQ